MHLCEKCEKPAERIIRPLVETSYPGEGYAIIEGIDLGLLDSIIENSGRCSLCRLVTRIWHRVCPQDCNTSNEVVTSEHDETARIHVCLDSYSAVPLSEDGMRLHWAATVEFLHSGRDGKPSTPVSTKWQPKFALLAADLGKLDLSAGQKFSGLGRSRLREARFDTGFLKSCLDTCLLEHKDTCGNQVREPNDRPLQSEWNAELPLRMRCIDVVNQNVVHVPRDGSCRYAVLSYVWGKSNYLHLTKATYIKLTANGGLRDIQLPRTISDAIEVTAALGIRYLWVDSLCIIQDYESEKSQQILKMDKIYASAIVTIVAADATEADGGLWTLNGGSREAQIVEEVAGLRFVAIEATVDDVLKRSVWNTRAWTYQEYALSKRLLIFSGDQAYFSCAKEACAEDYVDSVEGRSRLQLVECPTDTDFGTPIRKLANFPLYWSTLIREYTRRELSFEADALNAAAGVMAVHSARSYSSIICGLPLTGLFEYSMLWYPSQRLRRRSCIINGEAFPSWSWVGWVGAVTYEDFDYSRNSSHSQIIHQWSLESAQKVLHYDHGQISVSYPGSRTNVSTNLPASTVLTDRLQIDQHLSTVQSGILSFRTKCAKFAIATSPHSQLAMSGDWKCDYTGLYKIFHEGKSVGSIHLEHHVAQHMIRHDENLHNFFALSVCHDHPWYVHKSSDPRQHTDPEDDGLRLFDESPSGAHEGNTIVYNVMLARCEGKGSVSTRLGIGQIHKISFDEARTTVEEIRLG